MSFRENKNIAGLFFIWLLLLSAANAAPPQNPMRYLTDNTQDNKPFQFASDKDDFEMKHTETVLRPIILVHRRSFPKNNNPWILYVIAYEKKPYGHSRELDELRAKLHTIQTNHDEANRLADQYVRQRDARMKADAANAGSGQQTAKKPPSIEKLQGLLSRSQQKRQSANLQMEKLLKEFQEKRRVESFKCRTDDQTVKISEPVFCIAVEVAEKGKSVFMWCKEFESMRDNHIWILNQGGGGSVILNQGGGGSVIQSVPMADNRTDKRSTFRRRTGR